MPSFLWLKIMGLTGLTARLDFDSVSDMSTITFDTHKFVRKLKESGFDEKQAESLSEAMREAIDESELVTKQDLQIELAPISSDLNLLKWMVGVLLAMAIANFAKQFF